MIFADIKWYKLVPPIVVALPLGSLLYILLDFAFASGLSGVWWFAPTLSVYCALVIAELWGYFDVIRYPTSMTSAREFAARFILAGLLYAVMVAPFALLLCSVLSRIFTQEAAMYHLPAAWLLCWAVAFIPGFIVQKEVLDETRNTARRC